ncbi:MAG TPA: response regulator [Gemmatimonadaceae bacterium]|nr:response regulator [Gemmatimonadaceae bacterium]
MGRPLHALIVEDNPLDAELLLRVLRRGYDVTYERVETPEAMSEALSRTHWDIVLSDYSMPRFNAPAALALVRARKLDLPFIIISGTVGEDVAVEALHAGAQDFMAKRRLARLIPAIERELRDVALRAERAKMQQQLLISDRMASVGTLAAGVAHEINNPLAALMANLEFIAEDLDQLSVDLRHANGSAAPSSGESPSWFAARLAEIDEPLRDARDAAARVRNIAKDLKVFSHSDEDTTGAIDVRSVLESALRMASNEIRHRARLVEQYGDIPPVEGNEGRLSQVFLNLVVNAAQAIPEGNTDANEIRVSTWQDDDGRVVVDITDTGSGIPTDILPRIFDPFVTTKPAGIGTGLGLAICHRIITGLGGEITVESEIGKGTTFRATLPRAKSEARAAAPHAAEPAPSRRGRILVVDDEQMLIGAVRRMLSDHDVHSVTSPRDAIHRIEAGERFDVILCDLMMPEMTGMDLHAELSRVAPEQAERMIFMTGGAFTIRSRDFLDRVPNARVEKPFDASAIRALVADALRAQ